MFLPEFVTDPDEVIERAAARSDRMSWVARAAGSDETVGGEHRFIASEGRIDRHGDIIEQQSWRLENYRANPVILWEHGSNVVGKGAVKKETAEDGTVRLSLSVRFHAAEVCPLGMLADEQHRLGFRSAVSVGFIPGEVTSRTKLAPDDPAYVDPVKTSEWRAGYRYRFCELLEVSTVSVPALASALQIRAHAAEAEDPEEIVRRVLREMTGPQVRATLAEVAKHSPAFSRAVRSFVLGQPADPPKRRTVYDFLEG